MSASLVDAIAALAKPDTRVLAGGTDIFTLDWDASQQFVNISQIGELQHIEEGDDSWRIGAAVTWAKLCNADLPPLFDGLVAAGRDVGSIQIQNNATIVGNVCNASPAADGMPVLLAMQASIEVADGQATELVPIEQFVTGPRQINLKADQLVTAIRIPKKTGKTISLFSKLGSRKYLVISFVSVALVATIDNGVIQSIAISVGSCSAVACRLRDLETKLTGIELAELRQSTLVGESDLAVLTPIDDKRATADYRFHSAKIMLQRLLNQLAGSSV